MYNICTSVLELLFYIASIQYSTATNYQCLPASQCWEVLPYGGAQGAHGLKTQTSP